MKRESLVSIIILILLIFVSSCNLTPMDEGRGVNEYIFPYVNFALSEDGTYYTATIVNGAALSEVYITSLVDDFDTAIPVKYFAGFENKEDATALKEITIDASVEITGDAFENASNLEKIVIDGKRDGEGLSKLPSLVVAGKHFHGWKVAGEGAESLMYELVHYALKDPTCIENGNLEYWKCPECGKLFSNNTATQETTEDAVFITALGHKFPLIKVNESDSTCITHGYKAHWYCERCRQCFWDEEGARTAQVDELTKPFAHIWDEGWQSNEEYHWHVCEKGCGATAEMEAHKEVLTYNKNYHWYECSVCGRPLSNDETHTFDESGTYCTKCGYVYEKADSDSGFDVKPAYKDPTGEIRSSYDAASNRWTFTLLPTNQESLPTGWEWYVDGVVVDGEDTSTFEFTPLRNESYVIFCMFWNDNGAGSSEINI